LLSLSTSKFLIQLILFSVEAAEEPRLIPAALAFSSKKSLSKAAKELEKQ
jgi:hypothetical protein